MNTVFITGADRGIGYALCGEFLAGGWHVFAGQYMPDWPQLSVLKNEHAGRLDIIPLDVGDTKSVERAFEIVAKETETLDLLVNVAGIVSGDSQKELERTVQINSLGPLRMTELFLPLMQSGLKRLCYVSSEAGSISLLHRTDGYAYCASKAMLNMAVKLMFNGLRESGYTFRLYHPGWVKTYMSGEKTDIGVYEPEETAHTAYLQFTSDDESEDVLVMTDVRGEWWPF